MAQYLLLLHRPASTLSGSSPEEMRERIERYRAWRTEMTHRGKIVAGEKLTADAGLHLRKAGGEVLLERPDGHGNDAVISGYFVIRAEDDREAQEIAGECPHLDFGGTILLRQIDPT